MKTTQIRPGNTYGYISCDRPGDRELLMAELENGFRVGQELVGDVIETTLESRGFLHASECLAAYEGYITLRAKKHFTESGRALHRRTGECATRPSSDHMTVILDDLVALRFQLFYPGEWSVFASLLPDHTMRIRSAIFSLQIDWGILGSINWDEPFTETYSFNGQWTGSGWKPNPAMSIQSETIFNLSAGQL